MTNTTAVCQRVIILSVNTMQCNMIYTKWHYRVSIMLSAVAYNYTSMYDGPSGVVAY